MPTKKQTTGDIAGTAALVSTLSQQGGGGAMDPNLSALVGVLARKLQREEDELTQRANEQKAQQKQGAMAMDMRRKQQEAAQANCSHMKPWGGPALAGQRNHQHQVMLICQFCGKLFNGLDIPAHLRIPAERIGGPDN
jgi:hypothetical protein